MKVVICPYCGQTQPASERCRACGGLFEPLSRQATQNAMGPWFVRDSSKPFHPGCSYETVVQMIDRGQVTKYSIIRGPTTKQFWTVAKHVPGVAHVLGYCHNCDASVDPADHGCHACGVSFGAFLDRNYLGLPEVRPLPWEAELDQGSSAGAGSGRGYEWAGKGRAGSMSNFASDEELLRTAPGGEARVSAGDGATAIAETSTAAANEARDSPQGQSVFDEYASAAMTRSLQRRLAAQQRTVRILVGLLIVVVIVGLAANSARIASMFGGVKSPTDVEVQPEQPNPAPDAASAALPEPPSDPDPVVNSNPVVPVRKSESPGTGLNRKYVQALELITVAQQVDRPTQDRIGDYERALELLRSIDASAPVDQRPGDLADTITRVERDLERLRLVEFFPSPSG